MNDCRRLNLTSDEYARFIVACRLIARETSNEFDTIYQHAVHSKIYAGPFYGVVQEKMLV